MFVKLSHHHCRGIYPKIFTSQPAQGLFQNQTLWLFGQPLWYHRNQIVIPIKKIYIRLTLGKMCIKCLTDEQFDNKGNYHMQNSSKTFSPIKTKRVFEEIAIKIKESIFDGVWQPGEKLPSENELARQFGVSRHTIREALRILELSGLLYIKSGVNGGPIVQGDVTTTISNLYFDAFMMENVTVEEFTIARVAIEKAIVVEAIDKADEQDITNLKACLEKAKESLEKKDLSEINHFEFHSLLARASKNTVFIILERGINAIHNEMRSRIVEGTPEDYKATKAAYREHEKILEALIKKDREQAMKLLEKHIVVVGKTFKPKK